MRPRLHGASIIGRARADGGLLLLIGLVVMLAAILTSAVAPLTERTSDRAVAADVRDAGQRGALVATTPQLDDGQRIRDPGTADLLRQSAISARADLPRRLSTAVRTGVTSLTTPPLQLLDAGPGRYLRLAYVTGPRAAPATTYVAGGPPGPGVSAALVGQEVPVGDEPWPVQVALSTEAATALRLAPGDRVTAEDEQRRRVAIEVSGVFVAQDPTARPWAVVPELLHPFVSGTDATTSTSAAAIVSDDSMPDLRLAVPVDDLNGHVVFTPRPSSITWNRSQGLARDVVSLMTTAGSSGGRTSWDSALDRVIDDSRTGVTAARGQASVLITGLLASAFLVVVMAADLLIRRRSGTIALVRQRGGSLAGIFLEQLLEAVTIAMLGAAIGVAATRAMAGDASWLGALPVVVAASLVAPVLATVVAARSADSRRVPANRSARRAAARARHARRLLVEGLVVAAAILSYLALHQRGVTGGIDLTAASSPTWWTVVASLVVIRVFPALVELVLRRAHRTTGSLALVAAAQASWTRALPLVVTVLTVAQLTMCVGLAATEHHGQGAGALQSVGGDARLDTAPDRSVQAIATSVLGARGVRAAVAARVADGVAASSGAKADVVRLVVVDSKAYQRLLEASALADAPDLSRLHSSPDGRVPVLLRGGDPRLRDGLQVRWQDRLIPLSVVGVAPRVGASTDPVVIIDASEFGATGAVADPGTVWAVGPGAGAALRDRAGRAGSVEVLDDVVHDRRSAPLAAGLVHLAVVSSVLLVLFALVAIALSAAAEAPRRTEALGRLRSLGLRRSEVRTILIAELTAPVLVAALTGFVAGMVAALTMFGPLELELVTGQVSAPGLVVPWWTPSIVALLAGAALLAGFRQAARVSRAPLAALIRRGDQT
ncbi:MAG: FtsX-like permease family protein [Aeromicrobium sp.]